MSPIAKSDYNHVQIERVKQDIINNLKDKREIFAGGNSSQEIISEYDKYFYDLKNEKEQQIKSLEKIVEHLVKLNTNTNTLKYDIKKINDKINEFNLEISTI